MNLYEIIKGNQGADVKAANLIDAEAIALNMYGEGCTVTFVAAIPQKTAVQILTERQAFGAQLQQTFVLDNAPFAPTKSQAKQLLSKLRDAWELCELGSLQLCSEELTDVATDAIFTAERKAKYLLMISNFLTSE